MGGWDGIMDRRLFMNGVSCFVGINQSIGRGSGDLFRGLLYLPFEKDDYRFDGNEEFMEIFLADLPEV